MPRKPTILEQLHGKPPGIDETIKIWNSDLVHQLLVIIWKAYDGLLQTSWSKISWVEDYEQMETSLTQLLQPKIADLIDSYSPYYSLHGAREMETRKSGGGRPREYDIAFVWRADERTMWPIEAKVVKSDSDTNANLEDYVVTVTDRYLSCDYAPFSNSGAMLVYLKSGDPETVFRHIAKRMGCTLEAVKYTLGSDGNISSSCHKTSDHIRIVPTGKNYPANFRLHHLIMSLQQKQPVPSNVPPVQEAPDTPVSTVPPVKSLSPPPGW